MFLNDLEDFRDTERLIGISVDVESDQFAFFIKIFDLLYADDTIILADNADEFQACQNIFNTYWEAWKLAIKRDKSKVMIFGARKTSCYNFHLGDHTLEILSTHTNTLEHFSHHPIAFSLHANISKHKQTKQCTY